jgi:hypothetical protein
MEHSLKPVAIQAVQGGALLNGCPSCCHRVCDGFVLSAHKLHAWCVPLQLGTMPKGTRCSAAGRSDTCKQQKSTPALGPD